MIPSFSLKKVKNFICSKNHYKAKQNILSKEKQHHLNKDTANKLLITWFVRKINLYHNICSHILREIESAMKTKN